MPWEWRSESRRKVTSKNYVFHWLPIPSSRRSRVMLMCDAGFTQSANRDTGFRVGSSFVRDNRHADVITYKSAAGSQGAML